MEGGHIVVQLVLREVEAVGGDAGAAVFDFLQSELTFGHLEEELMVGQAIKDGI